MTKLAFGCSHTYGIGVNPEHAWPSLLGAINYGVPGCSSDLIARTMPNILNKHQPSEVYVLWPDWGRFEYKEQGKIKQSLATDSNRIQFMSTATDEWLLSNFNKQVTTVKNLCSEIRLIHLTFFNLAPPLMEYACLYPKGRDNVHYDESFHRKVAEIFDNMSKNNIEYELEYGST